MEARAKKRRMKRIIDNIVWCSAWLMVIMTLLIVINNQNVTHEKINDLSDKIGTVEQSVKDGNKMLKNEGQAVTKPNQVDEYPPTHLRLHITALVSLAAVRLMA